MRVVFLCFTPDLGHIQPIVKMARAARDAGHDIRCYLPQELAYAARNAGLKCVELPLHGATLRRLVSEDAARSIFFSNHTGYSRLNLFAHPELVREATHALPAVWDGLVAFAPDVVVADSYLFGETYRVIAAKLGAAYVDHSASGAAAHLHRPYVRIYGLMDGTSGVAASLVEFAGLVHATAYRLTFYLLHFQRWLKARQAKTALATAAAKLEARPGRSSRPDRSLTTGLTWIEETLLEAAKTATESVDLPPLKQARTEIPPDLNKWIDEAHGPVVYISFGSMLSVSREDVESLIGYIEEHDYFAIWSMPLENISVASDILDRPRIYSSGHVPQASLLCDPRIACFVTHAGASSVQEALIGGTPMLCVPLFGDNGYLSGLVCRLGVGRRVWRRQMSNPVFSETLREVVANPAYRLRSEEIAAQIAAADPDGQLVAFLEDAASPSR